MMNSILKVWTGTTLGPDRPGRPSARRQLAWIFTLSRPAAEPTAGRPFQAGIGIEDLGASGHANGTDDQAVPGSDHMHVAVVPVAEGTRDILEHWVVTRRGSHPRMLSRAR